MRTSGMLSELYKIFHLLVNFSSDVASFLLPFPHSFQLSLSRLFSHLFSFPPDHFLLWAARRPLFWLCFYTLASTFLLSLKNVKNHSTAFSLWNPGWKNFELHFLVKTKAWMSCNAIRSQNLKSKMQRITESKTGSRMILLIVIANSSHEFSVY